MRVTWVLFTLLFVFTAGEAANTMASPVTTSFSCKGRDTGFYADIDSDCKVYHTCDDHANKFTYKCPEKTMFRQETLVCDHEYLVDCKKSAKLISQVSEDSIDDTNNSSTKTGSTDDSRSFSRSFRITAQPSALLLAPRQGNKEPTTFFMSSTVFLRDQSNFQKTEEPLQSARNSENQRGSSSGSYSTTSTTSRPQQFNQKFKDSTSNFANLAKPKNLLSSKDSNPDQFRSSGHKFGSSKPAFIHNANYPYSETLRSIQSRTEKAYRPTSPRTTTAGTEFPIPALLGALSGSNNPQEDPYYPRHPASTEVYYTLTTRSKLHQPFAFHTRKPWLSNLDLKIPDVLPDLNSLEDIVDRRKHLFIPKSKSI